MGRNFWKKDSTGLESRAPTHGRKIPDFYWRNWLRGIVSVGLALSLGACSLETTMMPPRAIGGDLPGLVWLDSLSGLYYCPVSYFYGRTQQGHYLSEVDAMAIAVAADHGIPCSKNILQ